MKIKELHIRNIASIEQADINFEQDLTDGVSTDSAPLFLITGPTGTGKSVILDAISMALYGTTPRINDRSNAQKNDFQSAGMDTMGIYDIRQYTRLGISPKDPCYSEVVFQGNDGQTYTARMTLGLGTTRGNKEQQYKYRNKEWTLTDSHDHVVKKDTEAAILEKVGMSYEQFSRMVMLAQGQFATFLTGKRQEREQILEQLTNTAIFSKYGTAIEAIFKSAKTAKAQAESALNQEQAHLLSDTEAEARSQRRNILSSDIKTLDEEVHVLETRLNNIRNACSATEKLETARRRSAVLEEEMQTPEYREKERAIKAWNDTTAERAHLKARASARERLKTLAQTLEQLRDSYLTLATDIRARRRQRDNLEVQCVQGEGWLAEHDALRELSTDIQKVKVLLDNYYESLSRIKESTEGLAAEEVRTPALQQAVNEAQTAADAAAGKVKDMNIRVEKQQQERDRLNPARLRREHTALTERRSALVALNTSLGEYHDLDNATASLRKEIERLDKDIETKKQTLEAREKDLREAKDAADAARNRFQTMQQSLEDALQGLRGRLAQEKAEICPLCGQKISQLHDDEFFRDAIRPLGEEEQRLSARLTEAEQKKNDADTDLRTDQASLKAKALEVQKKEQELEKRRGTMKHNAESLEIDTDLTTLQQTLADALKDTDDRLTANKTAQDSVTEIQNRIDALQKELRQLNTAKGDADSILANARTALTTNVTACKNHKETISGNEETRDKAAGTVTPYLTSVYPDWQTAGDVREHVTRVAAEYENVRKTAEDQRTQLKTMDATLNTLSGFRDIILTGHARWQEGETETGTPLEDENAAGRLWQKLLQDVSAADTDISTQTETVATATDALKAWCTATGNTEEYLEQIDTLTTRISALTEDVNSVKTQKAVEDSTITTLKNELESLLESLKTQTVTELEDTAGLETEIQHKKELYTEKNREMGSIDAELAANAANKDKVAAKKAVLDAAVRDYDKWEKVNRLFGGTRFRNRVQTHILTPLLKNANIYLSSITDRYELTCSPDNEQLSILVLDKYNKGAVRSATLLSGGEKFMISLALSLALSSLGPQHLNVDILFIDEGFGTLDDKTLDSVMCTLESLRHIAGRRGRRVGIISHRTELNERIPVQVQVEKRGEGRSIVTIKNQ